MKSKILAKALEDIRIATKGIRLIHCMRGNSCKVTKTDEPQFRSSAFYEKVWREYEPRSRQKRYEISKNGFHYSIRKTRTIRPKRWLLTIRGTWKRDGLVYGGTMHEYFRTFTAAKNVVDRQ